MPTIQTLGATDRINNTYSRINTNFAALNAELALKQNALAIFNVTDYGAVFDGSTDDKAAIQLALNAAHTAGGGIVEMPVGTAKISNVLTIYSNTTLRGQGISATILQTTATSGALPGGAMIQSGNSDDFIRFEGFKLIGHGESQTSGKGIYMPNGVHSFIRFQDLYISGFPEYGIHIVDPILSSFEDLWLRDCGLDGLFVDIGTSCFFKTIYGSGNNRSNIHLNAHTYSTLNNCASEYSTLGYWLQSSSNITLNSCGGEVAIRANGGTAGIVAHCRIQSCSSIVVNGHYSTKFAYLNNVPAYHFYISGSTNIILNSIRGKTILGGADPGEIPTGTIYVASDSEVSATALRFDTVANEGIVGKFTNRIFSSGRFTEVTGVTQVMIPHKGYVPNNAALVKLFLPLVAGVGDVVEIVGKGAGGFRVEHGAGKTIHYGASDTSITDGGGLEFGQKYDSLKLTCVTADTDWVASTPNTLTVKTTSTDTIGKTSDGANSSQSTITKMVSSLYAAAASGIIKKGTARTWVDTGTANLKFAIYSDNAGAPGNKLAESDVLTISNTSEAANDFVFSGINQIPIINGISYWLCIVWDDPGSNNVFFSRDNTASGRVEQESFLFTNLPQVFGTPSGTFTGIPDAYITFTKIT